MKSAIPSDLLKLKKRFEAWRKTRAKRSKTPDRLLSRSGFARSLFRLNGLPRLRCQSPHSPAAILLKRFSAPLIGARS